MDELARYNRERWTELVEAGVPYSLPFLELDVDKARAEVDTRGLLGDVAGRDVLCLAGGGGQQSACFGLLGAKVTVLDITPGQLERDREAAAHYGLEIATVEGDMRDLSMFDGESFDIVWHAHSLCFIPDPHRVFAEVGRVLRPGGTYRLSCSEPHSFGSDESSWTGEGYLVTRPYVDGEVEYPDPHWDVKTWDGSNRRVVGPREFRHTMPTILNGLVERGLTVLHLAEYGGDGYTSPAPPQEAEPGTWDHLCMFLPPWLEVWARKG